MQKISLLVVTLLFFLITKPALARVIINQGKAEVHVETNTEAGESGSVTTHIETNVNGDKEVFDSSKSGKMDVDVKSDDKGTVTTTSGEVSSESGEEASPSGIHKQVEQKENLIKTFVDDIKNFFKNIFHFL